MLAVDGKGRRRCIACNQAFVDAIVRPAVEIYNFVSCELSFEIVSALSGASSRNHPGLIAAFFQVREPIVGHELDPKRGQHVYVIGFLIVTICCNGIYCRSFAVVAIIWRRLPARKELSADHLWIRLQQFQAIAVAILDDFVSGQLRESRFKLNVARKGLTYRSHERVEDVIADAGECAEAYQFACAFLRSIPAGDGE